VKIKKKDILKVNRGLFFFLITGIFSLIILLNIDSKAITTQVFLYRANLAYKHGYYDDAEILYKKALRYTPGNLKIRYNLANTYYKESRYTEAIEVYKYIASKKDDNLASEDWNNLGNAYYMQGNLLLSLNAYKLAMLYNNNDVEVRENFLFVSNKVDSNSKKDSVNVKNNNTHKNDNGNLKAERESSKKEQLNNKTQEKSQEMSNKTITDMLKKINQNEEATRGRISKSKFNNRIVSSTEPDY
jgi:tetratricopeptide (TPR) repeat protein